jgi:ligand-binding sensor domain-containing protein
MKWQLRASLLIIFCPLYLFCQEYGYTHYDSKDGLAGSTVYCMVQDKDGFLWFGTDIGLSRFDGTRFKNFTKGDGLPDNEIIQLFADSKGRIWIAPFRKTVCYYYKGKIHTQETDSVLKRIRITDNVIRFAEDKAGNILMQESHRLNMLDVNGQVTIIDKINERPINIGSISSGPRAGFMVIEGKSLYQYANNQFHLIENLPIFGNHFTYFAISPENMIWRTDSLHARAVSFKTQQVINLPHMVSQINFTVVDNEHVAQCTREGAYIYDISTTGNAQHFLPDLAVTSVLKDMEGNTWFSTLGHGVYRLSSPFVLNIKIGKNNSQVFSLARYGNSILASSDRNIIHRFNRKTGKPEKTDIILQEQGVNPIFALSVNEEKNILCGTSISVYKLSADFKWEYQINYIVVKALFLDRDKLYVATTNNVLVVDPENLHIVDTIWHDRATSVFVSNDTAYIGTLNGLYCFLPNRTTKFLGEYNLSLQVRITAMQKDSAGILWIGTYGDGLIGYKDDSIVAVINKERGLTSNVCRTVYLSGNALWVGTEKGLNKINVAAPGYPVTKYTSGDGLATEIINAIYVDSNKVFVGTPEGVTFFDEEKVASQSRCDLRFTDITIGGQLYHPDEIPVLIPHQKNSIQFNFVGISYKSTGDIRYRYRLMGLDTTWRETRETFLSYPTLPSGDYQLQLQAINKFDVRSKLLTAQFTIDKLLYERTWFRTLIGLLFLAMMGLLVYLIIRRIRKREREKAAISKRINELEQLSRKAQMNPHFIFNSLNSIQHYVMDADVAGANKFISGFSRLIRQTLDFSSKPEISLDEELDYLTNYLELEKTRLENAFSWAVSISAGVHPADYYIPPMILQPFVENSVRHGLRFRRDKNGVVTITVKRAGDHLVCILEDNGVGRKAAMSYKSISPINYQSKGLSLTADRIMMYNKEHEQKISMQIDDLEDSDHQALGTRVTINFPVL